ncbi:MAG: DNA recombination protein RmuC [Candidatus Paceibacteria bacterium]
MEPLSVIIVVLLIAVLGVLVYVFFLKPEKVAQTPESMLLMQQQLQELSRSMREQMSESNKIVQQGSQTQFRESKELMQQINRDVNEQIRTIQESVNAKLLHVEKNVAAVGESSKQVFAVADQLRELQNILKNPKQRGILGEYYLETVLQNVLPPESFKMQYAFNDGEIVDAAVFVKNKVIPVDSKFSLENYNRFAEAADGADKVNYEKQFVNDLKLRITETAKYIRPSEGTMDFAFMFIPHEGIYYDLLSNRVGAGEDNLIQRAAGKYKVIIVSPTSFLAYLQTVLQGLKAMEIEEKAQDIIKNVEKLSSHMAKYEDYYNKLGTALTTTVNHYNVGYKELGKVDKDIMKITGESAGVEALVLDKPVKGED